MTVPTDPLLERARAWMGVFKSTSVGCCPEDSDPIWEVADSERYDVLCAHDLVAFVRTEIDRAVAEERADIVTLVGVILNQPAIASAIRARGGKS